MQPGLGNCQIRSHLYYAVIVLYNTMPSVIRKIKINRAPSYILKDIREDRLTLQEKSVARCNTSPGGFLDWLCRHALGWIFLGAATEGKTLLSGSHVI